MSAVYMHNIMMGQVEVFQRAILGISPEKLSVNVLDKIIKDKEAHLEEEYTELNKAISLYEREDLATYYEILDGYCDLVYILLSIKWLEKYTPQAHDTRNFVLFSNIQKLLKSVRNILPKEIPYVYAFNLVHNANMKKKPGKKPGRIMAAGYDAIKPAGWKEPNWNKFFTDHLILRNFKKILIIGDARSGKDTYADILAYWYGYAFVPAYKVYGPHVMEELRKLGITYNSLEACYKDRVNMRGLWYSIISEYNSEDPTKLARKILNKSDIYVGIRNIKELSAAQHLFDRIIYTDASKRIPEEGEDSNTLPNLSTLASIFGSRLEVVSNNSSLRNYILNIYLKEQKYETD